MLAAGGHSGTGPGKLQKRGTQKKVALAERNIGYFDCIVRPDGRRNDSWAEKNEAKIEQVENFVVQSSSIGPFALN